jgi:hypothetical protein
MPRRLALDEQLAAALDDIAALGSRMAMAADLAPALISAIPNTVTYGVPGTSAFCRIVRLIASSCAQTAPAPKPTINRIAIHDSFARIWSPPFSVLTVGPLVPPLQPTVYARDKPNYH